MRTYDAKVLPFSKSGPGILAKGRTKAISLLPFPRNPDTRLDGKDRKAGKCLLIQGETHLQEVIHSNSIG